MATMYIFFIGGFLGGLLAGFLTDAISIRGAVIILGVPTRDHRRAAADERRAVHPQRPLARRRGAPRGAGGVSTSARPRARRRRRCRSRTSTSPTGPVQVLFDVNFEVQHGRDASRCSARTAPASRRSCASSAGSAVPERGVVRLNGRNITYVVARGARPAPRDHAAARRQGRVPEPHRRAEPGGQRAPQRDVAPRGRRARRARARAVPRARRTGASRLASSLSGGQQQMLALGTRAHPRARRSC